MGNYTQGSNIKKNKINVNRFYIYCVLHDKSGKKVIILKNGISIEHLRDGDKNSFKEVIMQYQRRVLKIAYGYTGDINDSADIAQEVFITLFKNIKKVTSLEHLKLYIYRITVSRSLDFLRKSKFKRLFIPFSDLSGKRVENFTTGEVEQERSIADSELETALKGALLQLSSNQKTVFMLKNYEGLTIKEIAQVTGKGESTVKTHLMRAMRSVRKYMRKNYAR